MHEPTDAAAFFAPLWKRKWMILTVGILVAAGTYAYYKKHPPRYTNATQIYLGAGAEESGVVGAAPKKNSPLSGASQAAIINSPLVHDEVVRRLLADPSPAAKVALRGGVGAGGTEKSQFITISSEAGSAVAAALLANITAQTFIRRQATFHEHSVRKAIAVKRRQLREAEAGLLQPTETKKGKHGKSAPGSSAQATLTAAGLTSSINELEASLSFSGSKLLDPATPQGSHKLTAGPQKNTIFGFVIGIALASFAAYAFSRFDRRLRTLREIETLFGTQILTALPKVRRPIVRRNGELMPSKRLREPLRRLHTTIQLGELLDGERERSCRSILFLSPDAGDGKSTLVAGLALAQCEAGERVAVLEADFRRPVQTRLLDVPGGQGLSDVLAGTLTVGEAMQSVEPAGGEGSFKSPPLDGGGVATIVRSSSTGSLWVLVSGSAVANPPALLARRTMTDLVRSLTGDFDYLLIDAPPPLQVSDVMPLLAMVDGIVVVGRVGHTRTISAERLKQLLERTPSAPLLGVVPNAVPSSDIEHYGYSSAGTPRHWWAALTRR